MNFPTLFEFAVEAVAEGFNRGTISIPFCLDSRPSDAIYKELLRLNSEDIKILKNFKNILNITKIEIDCLETYDVLNLSSFSLKSLTLKNIAKLYLKLPDRTHEGAISVDQFLKKVLNENSNNGLIHLGLTGSDRLTGNWVNEIAGLFPSLQSIDISETTFCQDFQFSVFCMAFPNIRVLNISNTNITSLLGIQNLQNLESLKMCNVYIACIDCYKELSELKKLTYLDISKTEISNHRYDPFYKIIKNLLDSEVRMDQLRCIDCSCTVVTRYELVTFSQRHPNLETVVALENMNETTVIPNVNLLNFCETGDILKSLHYSISNRKHNFISTCLQELKSILRFNFNDMSRSELADSMKVMLCIMETHYVDSWTRYDAVGVLSLMFQTGNLGKWSFLEIEIVLRRLFKQVNAMKRTMHMDIIQNLFGIVESIMNAVTARQQIPDALLSVIFLNITKAFTITPDMCLFYLPVLTKLQTEIMNWEQQCMSDDVKYVIAVFEMVDNVFAKREYRHYGGCLKILQFILERSEKSRKYLIEKGLHLKLIEHYNVFEGIRSPLRLEVLKILTFDLLISFS